MPEEIFDIIRKRYVVLTPEEKVRQHIVSVLINEKEIPQSLISIEAQIKVGKLIKRYDILVYDRNLKPWMLIECKRENIKITPEVLNQTIRYNQTIDSSYLLITNGIEYYCFKKDVAKNNLTHQETFPAFPPKINPKDSL